MVDVQLAAVACADAAPGDVPSQRSRVRVLRCEWQSGPRRPLQGSAERCSRALGRADARTPQPVGAASPWREYRACRSGSRGLPVAQTPGGSA